MRNAIIALALGAAAALLATAGHAQTPGEPTPLTPALLSIKAPIGTEDPIITWEATGDIAQYEITGTILAVRINAADPFCTPPLESDSRTLDLGETFEAATTEFRLPLPSLPPQDAWFFSDTVVTVKALDEAGQTIAAGNVGGIAETNVQCATPTVLPVLPDTGDGPTGEHHWPLALWLAIGVAGAWLAGLGALRARRG